MASAPTSLTTVERALKQSLTAAHFQDVHLYAFSRRTVRPDGSVRISHPLPIRAVSSILKETEYFSNLLTSGFADSSPIREHALPGEYDYESDSDLDEDEEEEKEEDTGRPTDTSDPTPETTGSEKPVGSDDSNHSVASLSTTSYESVSAPSADKRGQPVIPLRSVAHRTLYACLFYLYTGKTNFLPLRSTSKSDRQQALLTAREDMPPPCSPKSMFRLAEFYGITKLQEIAYQAITAQLTTVNMVQEGFSRFFARYDRLREYAASMILRNHSNSRIQAALQNALDEVLSGQAPHAGKLLQSLLGIRAAIVNSPSCMSSQHCAESSGSNEDELRSQSVQESSGTKRAKKKKHV
ncbi:hypothetical protein FKP32DRAFT_1682091 [Trametes sanguinea]|nr:hypothetical protein FKP32DRAFT_1682091 [Trametes sanguinea]